MREKDMGGNGTSANEVNDCDRHEVLVSAWLDGEIGRPEQLEMLDHLARCASCRGFYLSARALSGLLVASGAAPAAEPPSPEVWARVERSALSGARERGRWARRVAPGALAAAAAVLVVVLGAFAARSWMAQAPAPAATRIRLGEDAGRMTDAQFVELTGEVLRADRRYRTAFYEVMRQVVRDTADNEASVEASHPEGGVPEETAVPETARIRL